MSERHYDILKTIKTRSDIIYILNIKKDVLHNEIFKLACIDNHYILMDCILETQTDSGDRWEKCVYNWGLTISCKTDNINSIAFMSNKPIVYESYNKYNYIYDAIQKNNKFVLTYLATINPYCSYLSYKNDVLNVPYNEVLIHIFEKKIRIIQQWWKVIYYDYNNPICIKRLSAQYDELTTN